MDYFFIKDPRPLSHPDLNKSRLDPQHWCREPKKTGQEKVQVSDESKTNHFTHLCIFVRYLHKRL